MYQLLDFGSGRKLERFGEVVLDRPSPSAETVAKAQPELWSAPTARYTGSRVGEGRWKPEPSTWAPHDWSFEHRGPSSFRLHLGALPSGQVGIFPEQRANWDWIARSVQRLTTRLGRPPRALNLFATRAPARSPLRTPAPKWSTS